MNTRLSVVGVETVADIQERVLDGLLQPSWVSGGADILPRPLEKTLQTALACGCKTILVQNHVQDPDYLAEYGAYYSRLFRQVDRYCSRLHFFSAPAVDGVDALDFLDSVRPDTYLGFTTLRPLPSSVVGVTILSRPPGAEFVLSCDNFPVHIAGRDFSVKGTPFMQQDNAVGACAQAAIWMALRTIRKRVGNSALDPAQITNAATRFLALSRTMPNRKGLSYEQMMEAVRSAGHAPNPTMFPRLEDDSSDDDRLQHIESIRRVLYAYVESEIPVILGLFREGTNEGHAILLVGHDWPATESPPPHTIALKHNEGEIALVHAVSWISQFFVHNDNTGPYQPFRKRTDNDVVEYAIDDIRFAIPVLPNDVFMSAEEAEHTSIRLLSMVLRALGNKLAVWDRRIVIRTYLAERHDFRKSVLQSDMASTVKRYYREKVLPKKFWVTELSIADCYHQANTGHGRRLGEIVLDPTDDPKEAPFLSIHLNMPEFQLDGDQPGFVLDRDPIEEEALIKTIIVEDEHRYSPLVRQ